MGEEKKERWLNYLSLSTVILAVCATLATFKGGSFSTRSVMSQTQADDQWAFYQAKGLKASLYEIQKERLEMELQEGTVATPVGIASHKEKIAAYTDKITRYTSEKNVIEEEAKHMEIVREDAQRHAQVFGIAVIFLQIAILLSSIAALLKKKMVWYLGVVLGLVGVVYFANGFLLFFV